MTIKTLSSRLLWLLFIIALFFSAAVVNSRGVKGTDEETSDTLTTLADGSMIVNTTPLTKDIRGYAGPVPLRVHISPDGKVQKIEALRNSETPSFFSRAAVLFKEWEGKTLAEAETLSVDAVTGATFSSEAIKGNVRAALRFASSHREVSILSEPWTVMNICAFVVALLAATVPLFLKNRACHIGQQIVNVTVLGLGSGTFISYSLLLNLFTNGIAWQNIAAFAAPLVLLITAFIYPLFGKKGYYCAFVCPFGAAQELLGLVGSRHRVRLSPRLTSALEMFRRLLWVTLTVLLLSGIYSSWIDYELFTAFLLSSATVWVLVSAALFLVLSVFITRPYCRFVCPTGLLMRGFSSFKYP